MPNRRNELRNHMVPAQMGLTLSGPFRSAAAAAIVVAPLRNRTLSNIFDICIYLGEFRVENFDSIGEQRALAAHNRRTDPKNVLSTTKLNTHNSKSPN